MNHNLMRAWIGAGFAVPVCLVIVCVTHDWFASSVAGASVATLIGVARGVFSALDPASRIGAWVGRVHRRYDIPLDQDGFDVADILATCAIPWLVAAVIYVVMP